MKGNLHHSDWGDIGMVVRHEVTMGRHGEIELPSLILVTMEKAKQNGHLQFNIDSFSQDRKPEEFSQFMICSLKEAVFSLPGKASQTYEQIGDKVYQVLGRTLYYP